jgi:ferrous iron transport protein B
MTREQAEHNICNLQEMIAHSPLNTIMHLPEMLVLADDAATLEEKLYQPLRVAVLGEVKAGKSTLLNALAGGVIAPSDVTETTACIMGVSYSSKRQGHIFYRDQSTEDLSVEEIYARLESNRKNPSYFQQIEKVHIQLPLDGLKSITIVDTPGLATITEANEAVTHDYIQQVDVILWVLNANYLGQMEVNEQLRLIAKMGKPAIAVVNRIDEIDCDVQELIDYVDENLGIYVKATFPISAKKALDAILQHDNVAFEESGYQKLFTYLMENIERSSEDVKYDSITSSAEALQKKLEFIHIEATKETKKCLDTYATIERDLTVIRQNIDRRITAEAHHWIHHEFLSEFSREQSLENLVNQVAERAQQELDRAAQKFQEHIRSAWLDELSSINTRIAHSFHKMAAIRIDAYHNLASNQVGASSGSIADTMVTASAVGGGLALYAATLAPGAAYVSIGAALGAFMPPVLVAGALVAGVRKYVGYRDEKKKHEHAVDEILSGIRSRVETPLLNEVNRYNEEIHHATLKQSQDDFVQNYLDGRSLDQLRQLLLALEDYNRNYSRAITSN